MIKLEVGKKYITNDEIVLTVKEIDGVHVTVKETIPNFGQLRYDDIEYTIQVQALQSNLKGLFI